MEPIPDSDLTLEGLTHRIVEYSAVVGDCIRANNLPALSFDVNGPSRFPVPPTFPAAHAARLGLLEATQLLMRLVYGPGDYIKAVSGLHHDTASLRTIYRFNVAQAVPLEGDITYQEVATQVGLDVDRTRRIMQHAMTNGIFKQTRPGHVAHTGISAQLVQDKYAHAMVGHNVEDVYPSATCNADALEKHPENDGDPTETGMNLAFNTKVPLFSFFQEHPKRLQRFGLAMESLSIPGGIFDAAHVVRSFDWTSLGDATLVDVGGSRGHVSVAIAKAAPSMYFVVQDNPDILKAGEADLPPELRPRFQFMPFDFFNPQQPLPNPEKTAYFLRLILHDWADPYCIKILRNLISALKNGSKVFISESILPPPGTVNRVLEKLARSTDMQMLTMANSKERTLQEFVELLAAADPRFMLANVHMSPGSPLAIMEIDFHETAVKS